MSSFQLMPSIFNQTTTCSSSSDHLSMTRDYQQPEQDTILINHHLHHPLHGHNGQRILGGHNAFTSSLRVKPSSSSSTPLSPQKLNELEFVKAKLKEKQVQGMPVGVSTLSASLQCIKCSKPITTNNGVTYAIQIHIDPTNKRTTTGKHDGLKSNCMDKHEDDHEKNNLLLQQHPPSTPSYDSSCSYSHVECFKCHICAQFLVDFKGYLHPSYVHPNSSPQPPSGLLDVTVKSQFVLFCRRHFVELFKPRCHGCDSLIFEEECTEAEGKIYHLEHFNCFQCGDPLGGKQYIMGNLHKINKNRDRNKHIHSNGSGFGITSGGDHGPPHLMNEDKPYCLKCFDFCFGDFCQECGEIINCQDASIRHEDMVFHANSNCFKCIKCSLSLLGKPFLPGNDGRIYCSVNCFNLQLKKYNSSDIYSDGTLKKGKKLEKTSGKEKTGNSLEIRGVKDVDDDYANYGTKEEKDGSSFQFQDKTISKNNAFVTSFEMELKKQESLDQSNHPVDMRATENYNQLPRFMPDYNEQKPELKSLEGTNLKSGHQVDYGFTQMIGQIIGVTVDCPSKEESNLSESQSQSTEVTETDTISNNNQNMTEDEMNNIMASGEDDQDRDFLNIINGQADRPLLSLINDVLNGKSRNEEKKLIPDTKDSSDDTSATKKKNFQDNANDQTVKNDSVNVSSKSVKFDPSVKDNEDSDSKGTDGSKIRKLRGKRRRGRRRSRRHHRRHSNDVDDVDRYSSSCSSCYSTSSSTSSTSSSDEYDYEYYDYGTGLSSCKTRGSALKTMTGTRINYVYSPSLSLNPTASNKTNKASGPTTSSSSSSTLPRGNVYKSPTLKPGVKNNGLTTINACPKACVLS